MQQKVDERQARLQVSSESSFHRVIVTRHNSQTQKVDNERRKVSSDLWRALLLREAYQTLPNTATTAGAGAAGASAGAGGAASMSFEWGKTATGANTGVVVVFGADGAPIEGSAAPDYATFVRDLRWLWALAGDKATKGFAFTRLEMLSLNYDFHKLLNASLEKQQMCASSAEFFRTVVKVDNHIHAASASTEVELLEFIQRKARECPDLVVLKSDDGGPVTLAEALEPHHRPGSVEDLTLDDMHMAADGSLFHRFDHFNDSYNPFRDPGLRTVFMKTDNEINGRFFAELMRDVVFPRIEASKTAIEPRLSIYGRKRNEWARLAGWAEEHDLLSCDRVRWMIQIPRLFHVFGPNGSRPCLAHFQELLGNIFVPMFEATAAPTEHPALAKFLAAVGGIDCVDDESLRDHLALTEATLPEDYLGEPNGKPPPYSFFMYYLYANLRSLNTLRKVRGLNVLSFKPHCGEAGEPHHLATAFLTAESINHGINLELSPSMQYLYYLTQIGMCVCPLSNNALFRRYENSPIPALFRRGLHISLGTDDPLQFHSTPHPLEEEYALAAKFMGLTKCDLCEIARTSVRISGFSGERKREWLGPKYERFPFPDGDDPNFSGLPAIRSDFRFEALSRELCYVLEKAGGADAVASVRLGRLHFVPLLESASAFIKSAQYRTSLALALSQASAASDSASWRKSWSNTRTTSQKKGSHQHHAQWNGHHLIAMAAAVFGLGYFLGSRKRSGF